MASDMNFKALLVKKGQLRLPFIGKFTLKYRSAYIDHVENKIYPPAKVVVFDLDTEIDDQKCSPEEIEWSKALQDACAENGSATINDIGTLKKVNNYWVFNSLENNLGSDYQGLPDIEATPILKEDFVEERVEEQVEELIDETSKNAPQVAVSGSSMNESAHPIPASSDRSKSNKKELFLGLLMGLSVFIIAVILFNNYKAEPQNNKLNVSHRVNKKPKLEDAIWDDSTADKKEKIKLEEVETDEVKTAKVDDVIKEKAAAVDAAKFDTTSEVIGGNGKNAVIIIGAFKSSSNIESVKQKIKKMGYGVYNDNVRGLERIGVKCDYNNLSDLTRKIENVSEVFNSQAWVLKK